MAGGAPLAIRPRGRAGLVVTVLGFGAASAEVEGLIAEFAIPVTAALWPELKAEGRAWGRCPPYQAHAMRPARYSAAIGAGLAIGASLGLRVLGSFSAMP
jgi:hypothetical protein